MPSRLMEILETLNNSATSPEDNSVQVVDITSDQLALINQQTLVPYSAEQLFVFKVLLIDDSVTRNMTQYPESFQRAVLSKPARKGNWIGLTFLMGDMGDHEAKAKNQKARIFNAYLVQTPNGGVGTMAEAYIPLNQHTDELVESIKAGIHREVSIGVAVEVPACSICGLDIRECEHIPGQQYEDNLAYISMQGDAEAHEVSFVAVPGSYNAQILSDTQGYIPLSEGLNKTLIQKKEVNSMKKTLKEALAKFLLSLDDEDDNKDDDKEPDMPHPGMMDDDKSDDEDDNPDDNQDDNPDDNKDDDKQDDEDDDKKQEESLRKATEKLAKLKEDAKYGRVYKKDLLAETLRLGLLSKVIPVQAKETFAKTFAKLSVEELKEFHNGYKAEVERLYPATGKAVALTENIEEANQVKPVTSLQDIVAQFNKHAKGAR